MVTGTIIRKTYKINNTMKTYPRCILILSNFEKKISPNFFNFENQLFLKFYYIMYRIARPIFTDNIKKNTIQLKNAHTVKNVI